MAGPAWLDRLELRHSAPRFYAGVTVLAALDGAMLCGLVGRWLVLPGLAVALVLLWLIAVHTGQRIALTLMFLLSTAVLFVLGLFLVQDRALQQHGEWIDVVVTSKARTRVNSTCELRRSDGAIVAGPVGGCRGARPGDRIRVFHDPEGRVPPSWSAPHVARWLWAAAGANIAFTACSLSAAVLGVRGNRRADAQRPGASGGRPVPPPPRNPPVSQ
ncbi:hypothetical protein ACH4NO_09320 [Streptomyces olivaceus]|uniref:hypothetical protein n=1 Tax=Streptomyces olivaceus TaxID=47716 RepID=UPI0004CBDAE6|nr:hypothetical protein [Streptomyces olivaceus]MBZ6107052.1 hypothetical protein [Streptomyces olivaceus]